MSRRPQTAAAHEKKVDEMIERFQASTEHVPAEPAVKPAVEPEKPEGTEEVLLLKKTFLYGSVALAGSLVTVPTTIANVLRAKGIVK